MVFWKGPADLTISNPFWGKQGDLCAFLHIFCHLSPMNRLFLVIYYLQKNIYSPLPFCDCVCIHVCTCTGKDVMALGWSSEVSFQEWLLCLHHLGSGDWTQVLRVGRRCLCPWVISPAASTPLSTVLFDFARVALSDEWSIDCIKKLYCRGFQTLSWVLEMGVAKYKTDHKYL